MKSSKQFTFPSFISKQRAEEPQPILISDRPIPANKKHFDYNNALRLAITNITSVMPEFSHIDTSRIYIGAAKARNNKTAGTQAKVTGLRFRDGKRTYQSGRWKWHWPDVYYNNREILYLITVYLPRFHNLSFKRKVETLVHELYHISPLFDGGLRIMGERKYAHGGSREKFHERCELMAERYLINEKTDYSVLQFLYPKFHQLEKKYGTLITGMPRGVNPVLINGNR